MFKMLGRFNLVAALAVLAMLPGLAMAQGAATFDPSEALEIIGSALAFIIAVGTAVVGLIMASKGFKLVRRAG